MTTPELEHLTKVLKMTQDAMGLSDYEKEEATRIGRDAAQRANLHASAPDLLAVVKRIAALKKCDEAPDLCHLESGPYCGTHDVFVNEDLIDAARDAIKKAEGRS